MQTKQPPPQFNSSERQIKLLNYADSNEIELKNDKYENIFSEDEFNKIINEFFPMQEKVLATTLKYDNEEKFKIKCENSICSLGIKLNKDNMVKITKTDKTYTHLVKSAALSRQDFNGKRIALDCNIPASLLFKLNELFDSNIEIEINVRLEEYNTIVGESSLNHEEKERGLDFYSLKENNFCKALSIFFNENDYVKLEDKLYIYSNGSDGIYFEEILENNDENHNELFNNIRYTHMIHCMLDASKQYFTHIDYQILKYSKESFNNKFKITITEDGFKSQKTPSKYKLFRIDNAKIPIEDGKILYKIINTCFLNNDRIIEYFTKRDR